MEEPKQKRIFIRMFSSRLQFLNKVSADFVAVAKGMDLKVVGPVSIPPRIVNIKTRINAGTNFRRNFELRIHENLIEVFSSTDVVEQIISGSNECDVKIEVIVVGVRGWTSKQGQLGASIGLSESPEGSVSLGFSRSRPMEEPKQKHIIIRMFSRRLQFLNKVSADFVAVAEGMGLKVVGPVRIPPRIVNIKTRINQGTNFRSNFELCIHENLVEVFSSTEVVEQIISGSNECNVKIEVIVVGVRGWTRKQGQLGASIGLSQSPEGSEPLAKARIVKIGGALEQPTSQSHLPESGVQSGGAACSRAGV